MAEQDSEKTQDATPHRRQQAREEGNLAKSQDLASAVLLIAGVVSLMVLGNSLVEFFGQFGKRQFGGQAWLEADPAFVVNQSTSMLLGLGRCLLPILGILVLAGIIVNLAQTGFLFLPSKLGMDLNRLNVLQAAGRMFSMNNIVRLGFGLVKIGIVAAVAYLCVAGEMPIVLGLTGRSPPEIASYLAQLLLWTTLKIAIALLILALLDYGYQWWRHEQDLKMTTQEVREEMRNMEGDPQVAARRRQVQRQLVMNRLGTAVPKADVVVTNPTELAIAIQYDPESMAAPVVVAKGADAMAARIRKIALENGIPIVEKKPLAQALYKEVDVGKPIPQDRYAAVAEILAYVYQLKGKKLPRAA